MATTIMKYRFDKGDLVRVTHGKHIGRIGIVDSYKEGCIGIINISDCRGGLIPIPELHMENVTKSDFIKLVVEMHNILLDIGGK